MALTIFNTNKNPPVPAITFDEKDTPTVYESTLESDLKSMGICTTPFTELRKKDPLFSKRDLIFQKIDPEGKEFYRRCITLPSPTASSEEKAYFKQIFIKYFQAYLINHGYEMIIS